MFKTINYYYYYIIYSPSASPSTSGSGKVGVLAQRRATLSRTKSTASLCLRWRMQSTSSLPTFLPMVVESFGGG